MRRTLADQLKLAWALREPDGILPLILVIAAVVVGGVIWVSRMSTQPVPERAEFVNGRVEAFAIHFGKTSRVGYARVSAEGRKWYFVLPVSADCRVGDVFILSRKYRGLRQGRTLVPELPNPCRRPELSQQ